MYLYILSNNAILIYKIDAKCIRIKLFKWIGLERLNFSKLKFDIVHLQIKNHVVNSFPKQAGSENFFRYRGISHRFLGLRLPRAGKCSKLGKWEMKNSLRDGLTI